MKQVEERALEALKPNGNNPRKITPARMEKLKNSLESFPDMLQKRPIIVDEEGTILAGNMRYRALKELGYEKAPVITAKGLTPEQKEELLIKDNVGFGEWDYDVLANEYDQTELTDWGLDVVINTDYGDLLDDLGGDEELEQMAQDLTKGIQIPVTEEQYVEFTKVCKGLREQHKYVGGIALEAMRNYHKDNGAD